MTKGEKVMTGQGRAMLAGGHAQNLGFGRGRDDTIHDSGSGYGGGKKSPFGLGGAIAVHALAVGVFLLVPGTVYKFPPPTTITGRNIPIVPPPPEIRPDTPPKADSKAPIEQATTPDTLVKLPTGDPLPRIPDVPFTPLPGDGGIGIIPQPTLPPIPTPVLVEAQIDARVLRAFQPDYPGAMIRLNEEGKVTVRVTIGADGHVTDIERLSASNDAFWVATERHARKAWRFRPATRDGVPVSGTKILTVYFKLERR